MTRDIIVPDAFAFDPSPAVAAALDDLGRTEDIQFSPDQSRLAIAGFKRHKLLIIEVAQQSAESSIGSTRALEVTSELLVHPHGLAWLDDETLVVANRGGKVVVFQIPPLAEPLMRARLDPVRVLDSPARAILKTPGSVAVHHVDGDTVDVVVCNNYVHTVSRHRLRRSGRWEPIEEELLFGSGLDVPDGIAIAAGGRHVAVSNHDKHRVDVFSGIRPARTPVCRMTGCDYPHGVHFLEDGRTFVMADAGAPLVHIYRSADGDWLGWRKPIASLQVISDEAYARGHQGPGEGGPKGVDLTADGRVMVVSCEEQPIAFFAVGPILDRLARERRISVPYMPRTYERIMDAAPGPVWRHPAFQYALNRLIDIKRWLRERAGNPAPTA
jgi:DNA-binding beta-propeller fold protein YncE